MDFLDPQKQRRHTIRLMIGYVLVGLAILIGTTILLYEAYGFSIGKNNQLVQKGFVFVSSHPAKAKIYLDGKLESNTTNTRLNLVSDQYVLKLTRDGYRDWQRNITVLGGTVEHFDYPFLFPQNLITTTVKAYDIAPEFTTQTLDHRWLLVAQTGTISGFDEYDLKNPKQAPQTLMIPTGVVTAVKKTSSWELVEWSNDNKHVLLKHDFDGSSEYIVIDRADMTQSFNLTTKLGTNPTAINLINQKYDQYYLYDATQHTIKKASLNDTAGTPFLSDVYGYKGYGSDIMLFATTDRAPKGKVAVDLLQSGVTYQLRTLNAGSTYLLDLAQYDGSWYVAAGASTENKVYIYKNPVDQLKSDADKTPVAVAVHVLTTSAPMYLKFSANAQFIMDENGTSFSVYDVFNDAGYDYTSTAPLDKPQLHATWMDGDRLQYVSNGKLVVFDYDHANVQTLMAANPAYLPAFDPSYKFVDSFVSSSTTAGQTLLTSTALLTPQDQ